MNCHDVKKMLESGEESVEMRQHLRSCADCLELAVSLEPTTMFTTLGGDEMVPPGGVELFVSDVMGELRLREKERSLDEQDHPKRIAWWWSAAATIFILFTTWLAIQPDNRPDIASPAATVAELNVPAPMPVAEPAVTRPVIDDYDRTEATIVELPSESADDVKIVMIFDETLPQDL